MLLPLKNNIWFCLERKNEILFKNPSNSKVEINNKANFYLPNSLLNLPGGHWYDLYSKALHSYGNSQPVSTFAYDRHPN